MTGIVAVAFPPAHDKKGINGFFHPLERFYGKKK